MKARRLASAFAAVLALTALSPLAGQPPPAPRAVVSESVQDLHVRPDETSPVDDQAILGDSLEVIEETSGFAKVRTDSGNAAWIPERAIRRGVLDAGPRRYEVLSPLAHLYPQASFTKARPLLTAPMGARVAVEEEVADADRHIWARVRLPDGRVAFVAREDVAPVDPVRPPVLDPARWIALGKRFLGAPYTWGGTTPLGFDCSGLVYRLLRQHGVLVKRNSFEHCFREPKLVPVRFEDLAPGDLLFFGTEDRIDHEAIWTGGGQVLQATAYGVPSTQLTMFAESPRLKDRFRYARRLAALPNAPRPGRPDARKLGALKARVEEIAAGARASLGVVFKDLTTGEAVKLGERNVKHAASTMKTPILLELLRRVDAGELKLLDELPVSREFKSLVDGSPFQLELEPDTDGPTAAKLGGTASLEFLMTEMIQRSSNLATNILLTHLTPAAVQKLTDALGAPTVKVRRCVEDTKAYEKGLNNETDAEGMAAVMEACVRSPKLSADARKKAWDTLAGQVWNDQIPAGLHPQSGAVVAHKTGWISSVEHDAAIVRLPDGREYVLVVLANDFGANAEGHARSKQTARKISRAAWEHMIAP